MSKLKARPKAKVKFVNQMTLVYHEEYCIGSQRLIDKGKGLKKKPFEKDYSDTCAILERLTRLDPS